MIKSGKTTTVVVEKKSKFTGKDMLLMLMTVLKHVGQWDILVRVFKIKGPTHERMITRFARLISAELYKVYVQDIFTQFSMTSLRDCEQLFSRFTEALYAVDVTLQQYFRPSGSI